jgi:hypothetical protein
VAISALSSMWMRQSSAQHAVRPVGDHRLVGADHDGVGEVLAEGLERPASQHEPGQQDDHAGREGDGAGPDRGRGHHVRGQVDHRGRGDQAGQDDDPPANAGDRGGSGVKRRGGLRDGYRCPILVYEY